MNISKGKPVPAGEKITEVKPFILSHDELMIREAAEFSKKEGGGLGDVSTARIEAIGDPSPRSESEWVRACNLAMRKAGNVPVRVRFTFAGKKHEYVGWRYGYSIREV